MLLGRVKRIQLLKQVPLPRHCLKRNRCRPVTPKCCFLPPLMSTPMWWLVAAGGLGYLGYCLVRFALADADLHLLSKRSRPKAVEGKVVWITGASQGLGALLAQRFASRGARVILSSRRAAALEDIKSKLPAREQDVLVLPVDICSKYAELEQAVHAADSAFDGAGVDVLVHCAGASQHALAEETTAEVTEMLFKLNTLAPINLTRAILPRFLERGRGHIVVIASMAGKVPSPGQAVYSGAKFAVCGYFKSLAAELADRPVDVTICCPGPFSSDKEGARRAVYGATGLLDRPHVGGGHNVKPERAADLILTAVENRVEECWIAKHPVLLIGHIMQFLPRLGFFILKKVGPKRARAMKEGKNAYSVAGMLGPKQDTKPA